MALGLPEILVVFKSLAVSAIARSARGIVAILLLDDTEGGEGLTIFKSLTDVDHEHWSEESYQLFKLLFSGGPSKVIALRQKTDEKDVSAALKALKNVKWNYFCFPKITPEDQVIVTAWVKEQRDGAHKTFKAVLPSAKANHEGIINFTTDRIASDITGKTHSSAEYCCRIAGVLAGLPLSRSSTFFTLSDVTSAAVPDDPDERIDKGELILIYDDGEYKIGRGVNSLTTFTESKPESKRFVKVVEGMDLYQDDIRESFKKGYVGKYVNDYDHKQMFVAAVRAYQKELAGDVLDAGYENTAQVSLDAQRQYLEAKGIDTSKMSETEVLKANTGTKVFIESDIRFVNTMEDLKLVCTM